MSAHTFSVSRQSKFPESISGLPGVIYCLNKPAQSCCSTVHSSRICDQRRYSWRLIRPDHRSYGVVNEFALESSRSLSCRKLTVGEFILGNCSSAFVLRQSSAVKLQLLLSWLFCVLLLCIVYSTSVAFDSSYHLSLLFKPLHLLLIATPAVPAAPRPLQFASSLLYRQS